MISRPKALAEPMMLRISGIATRMTAVPDDDELAAQALLESLSAPEERGGRKAKGHKQETPSPKKGTPEYFRQIARRVKDAHDEEERRTKRFLAWCHDRLVDPGLTPDELAAIERDIYLHQECVEREKGELLRRWQHCLAETTVRQMTETGSHATDDTEISDSY